ncbi:MAG: portal protein, partial [Candidatus Cloacimonadota bacterium]|nr:portal protein [Candidatus Cloacimonadota bacterium]
EELNISQRFEDLESLKNDIVTRAREASELTIPYIFTGEDHQETNSFEKLYQNLGSYGVNNLSSRLLLALFPPNKPFFRMSIKKDVVNQLDMEAPGVSIEIKKSIQELEKVIQKSVENSDLRSILSMVGKQLIIGGNSLLYMPDKGGIKVYNLENFNVKRDTYGNVLEVISKEKISKHTLSEEIYKKIESETDADNDIDEEDYDLYTRCYLKEGKWVFYQEILEVLVSDVITYDFEDTPFIPVRWTRIKNESYGRGMVEDVIDDLKTLENLTKSVTETSLLSSQVKFIVNPSSNINLKQLIKSKNGEFIQGDINKIGTLQVDKTNDLQIGYNLINDITMRISKAFMLNQGVQRQGERVTATEVQTMANELEDTFGSIYSTLSRELQLPITKRFIKQLRFANKIPELPFEDIDLEITTGLEALGRRTEIVKLQEMLQVVGSLGEQGFQYFNVGEYINRYALELGVDIDGLLKTDEQLQQEAQQAQQGQMQQQQQMMEQQVGMEAGKEMILNDQAMD